LPRGLRHRSLPSFLELVTRFFCVTVLNLVFETPNFVVNMYLCAAIRAKHLDAFGIDL
jgi:hypothetical protein